MGGSLWQPIVWVLFTHSMGNIVPILWVNPESPSVPIVWVSERTHSMGDSQVTHTMGHGFTHSMGDPCRDSKSPIVWVVVGTHSMGGWPYYGDLASACQWQSLVLLQTSTLTLELHLQVGNSTLDAHTWFLWRRYAFAPATSLR